MRLQGQFRVYWINAICINQDSVLERNHQVQMMRQIYSNAESVSVWLGEADRELTSDIAMDFLATRSRIFRDGEVWPKQQKSFPWSKHQAESLLDLCRRDYWSRVWIVQEIFLAEQLTICCGAKKVSWQTWEYLHDDLRWFRIFTMNLYGDKTVGGIYVSRALEFPILRGQYRTFFGLGGLSGLLALSHDHEASNILDKVYGVCGLLEDPTRFPIDYGISPEKLLDRLLRYTYIPGQGKTKIYDLAGMMSRALGVTWSSEKTEKRIPSL
jgi:hypothetical protein